jgi:lactoylglutathione lyase
MTTFVMTKLVVGDLERAKAFYGEACDLREIQRIDGVLDGRPITEIIMGSDAPAAATLVLFAYHNTPAPPTGECMLVFETKDIDGFMARAVTAGASTMLPPQSLPQFGLSYAFIRDPEGHVVEVIQRSS